MSESAHAQPLSEPRTPMWLPAVGAALFTLVGVGWALCPAARSQAADTESAAAAAVPAPAAQPVATVARPQAPAPAGSAATGMPRIQHMPGVAPTKKP